MPEEPAGQVSAQVDKPQQDVSELRREAAAYRTQRNASLREAHAFRTILDKHGIDVSHITPESLNSLPISGGRVDGVFDYTPPKITAPANKPAPEVSGPAPLTLEEARKLPPAEINKRWDEISNLMKQGA